MTDRRVDFLGGVPCCTPAIKELGVKIVEFIFKVSYTLLRLIEECEMHGG